MDQKESGRDKALKYAIRTAAAAVYAMGISLFLDPNSLAPGGVSGISIILNRITSVDTGTLILLLNIPILMFGAWRFGIRFMFATIYSTVMASLFINLIGTFPPITRDPLLAALAGGCLVAVGIGVTFRSGSTTGGMDIVIRFLREKLPHLKTGSLMLGLDAVVVSASALAFRDVERALYAGISLGVTSFVLDLVLYGRDSAKLIYIISDHAREISERLLRELGVGVTYLEGAGAYSGKEKQVIFCVMRKPLSPKAEAVVKEEDPHAFLIVTNATEIYGEGYKSYFGEKL